MLIKLYALDNANGEKERLSTLILNWLLMLISSEPTSAIHQLLRTGMKQLEIVFLNTTKLLANKPIANGQLEKNSKENAICAFHRKSQKLLKASLNVQIHKIMILQLAIYNLAKCSKELDIKVQLNNVCH